MRTLGWHVRDISGYRKWLCMHHFLFQIPSSSWGQSTAVSQSLFVHHVALTPHTTAKTEHGSYRSEGEQHPGWGRPPQSLVGAVPSSPQTQTTRLRVSVARNELSPGPTGGEEERDRTLRSGCPHGLVEGKRVSSSVFDLVSIVLCYIYFSCYCTTQWLWAKNRLLPESPSSIFFFFKSGSCETWM